MLGALREAGLAIVNKAALSGLLGFSERTLTEWQQEGLPIVRTGVRGQENEYDTVAVVAWMLERAARRVRADNPKDELYRVQKRLIELQIGEKEKTLVNLAEVQMEFTRMVVHARQRLLQLAELLAPQLEAATGEEAKRALLDAAIKDALIELSEYGAAGPDVAEATADQ